MLNLEPMVTAVTFIEDHLQENIKVADMADAVNFSLFHFCRTFNKIVHHTPYDYLIRRRLSESARLLLETDQRITDIAFTYQFNSLETYSRAFRRLFGQLPRDWRKGQSHAYRIMPRLTQAHLEQRNHPDFIRHQPTHQEPLPLAGVMSLIDSADQTEIAGLWAKFQEMQPTENDNYYGLHWLPEDAQLISYFYMAAIQSETEQDAWVMKRVEGGMYGRFQTTPPFATRQLLLDYIIHTWLPQSGLMLAHPFILERHKSPPHFGEPAVWEMFVPVLSET